MTLFHDTRYLKHNAMRLQHLDSLKLNLNDQSVLELGAGIGDHTNFFLQRGCTVTSIEGRIDNVKLLKDRYRDCRSVTVMQADLDATQNINLAAHDIVYCYGILYHLSKPEEFISFAASHCKNMLLLETCVSSSSNGITFVKERPQPTQSLCGTGCRPSRQWVYSIIHKHIPYVYMPITQPNHHEFPTNWNSVKNHKGLIRAIYVATHNKLDTPILTSSIPIIQTRIK